jgi:hypothetical protein
MPARVLTHKEPSSSSTMAMTLSLISPSLEPKCANSATRPSGPGRARCSPPPSVPIQTRPSASASRSVTLWCRSAGVVSVENVRHSQGSRVQRLRPFERVPTQSWSGPVRSRAVMKSPLSPSVSPGNGPKCLKPGSLGSSLYSPLPPRPTQSLFPSSSSRLITYP